MKKQKRQLLILAVICALCIGGYLVIRNGEFEEEDTAAEVTVTDFDADSVTALLVSGDVSLDFVKEEGEWKERTLPEETISQESITGLISQINHITTTETVVEAPEELGQYGLEDPVRTISLTFEDETGMSIFIGDKSSLLGKYYIQVSGDANVYLVSAYIVTDFEKTPEDFVEEAETEAESAAAEEDGTESAAETGTQAEDGAAAETGTQEENAEQ